MSSLIQVRIQSLSHDGRGITSINGKTTFVQGALPDEEVLCQLTKKHSRYNEANTIEVLSASKERISPICKHFGICGGCSMQHISNQLQIEFKQKVLLEQLKHFGNVIPKEILPPISGETTGYRRKARLGVRYVIKKNKLLVGFREKNSRFLADIEECPILHRSIGNKIVELSKLIQGLIQFEYIPQIELAISHSRTALIFRHLEDLPDSDINQLCEFGKKQSFDIYLQPNSPAVIHKIWPLTEDNLFYSLLNGQLTMQFDPLDFTQINDEINQLLIQQALQLLDLKQTDQVLDLFCGLGNFTLPIALSAKKVIGIEGSQKMVDRASFNAIQNNIKNTEFYAANLMDTELKGTWLNNHFDKILLDPPRSGAKEIIPIISKFAAKKIVYVSCNPATLARDAGYLVNHLHYQLSQVGVINMFPHTSHIEAIALFEV